MSHVLPREGSVLSPAANKSFFSHHRPEGRHHCHDNNTHCSSWYKGGSELLLYNKIKQNVTQVPKWSGWARLAPSLPSQSKGRELTRRCQVPTAGTPGGGSATLKGQAVKVTGGLRGCAEWGPGGKQTLNFQLGLDLPGSVWRVCKGADEAFRAFGWVSKRGSGGSRLLPVGLTGGFQRNTKASVNLEKGLETLLGRSEAPRLGRGLGAELPESLGFCGSKK